MMIFRIALSIALLIFIIQTMVGSTFEKGVMRSLLYFIIFYTVLAIYQTVYLHVKSWLKAIDDEKKHEDAKREREERFNRQLANENVISTFLKK